MATARFLRPAASATSSEDRLATLDPTIPLRFMVRPSYDAEGGTGLWRSSRYRRSSKPSAHKPTAGLLRKLSSALHFRRVSA
ncbi:MAG: hypothetical protein ACOXZI_01535 [Candidatus Cryptobacteroides sp.]|nr:hypothetical protein [Rikenellaceae bacterium]